MTDKTHLLRLKPPALGVQHVLASSVEVHGEHLVLLNSEGKLAALFLTQVVESWNVLPAPPSLQSGNTDRTGPDKP
jgi:hypothetical protein